MSAGRICNRVVATAALTEMVATAAARMREKDVGTLFVLEGDRPAGILTDRDIALRLVARGLDPETTPVSEVMTRPVHSVDESTPIEEAVSRMASAGTRRLAVTGEAGRLVGILALDDVLDLLIEEAGSIGEILSKQKPKLEV